MYDLSAQVAKEKKKKKERKKESYQTGFGRLQSDVMMTTLLGTSIKATRKVLYIHTLFGPVAAIIVCFRTSFHPISFLDFPFPQG